MSQCSLAEDLSNFISQVKAIIIKNPIQAIECFTNALKVIKDTIKQVANEIKKCCSAIIDLRYKDERLSRDFDKLHRDVLAFIDMVKSFQEMHDDKERIKRIRAEIRKQGDEGTTHYDIERFPELHDFLTELVTRVEEVKKLSSSIDEGCKSFSICCESAEKEAERMGNRARWLKYSVIAGAAVVGGVATGGLGFALCGAGAAAVGAFSIGGGGGGFLSYMISRKYSHEREFNEAQEKFKKLDKAAVGLQKITGNKLKDGGVKLIENEIKCGFHREQPPLCTQLPESLNKLLKTIRFEELNFIELKAEVKKIGISY